ncbi:TetR/AcrR family transcriptional regulator [Amycolatopsis taiwanensis]|uniref:TetR family transcriptional regulator n=1 Tax=Amycolatopsis taiwanensis TaxID=342230 RepID=A0A9W6VD31_9PSEU|nr:TetR/AcrR family transcriptional regulator [Amycolatopsis taiwanensis]GLY64370.1 TetR family transcriptional regulator [Amycolatopsis taiwanensis]
MGNREDLLAGAKRCLYEKGYSRTTARDIASAAGVSLASIGYHFGSTKALLNAAVFEAMADWGDKLGQAMATGERSFEAILRRVLDSYRADRPLWQTQVEMVAHLEHEPELRREVSAMQSAGRFGLAEIFLGLNHQDDEQAARAAGMFYQVLMSGLLVQWLIDPELAPSAEELAEGMRLAASATDRA